MTIIARKFATATTAAQWRAALKLYRETNVAQEDYGKLNSVMHIARVRLGLNTPGLPRVRPRGLVVQRVRAGVSRAVEVEELA